jgi:protein-disulfide isomerase
MRSLALASLITTSLLTLLACRQPTASLELPDPREPEPSGLASPSVIVEAPTPAPARSTGSLVLDWTTVDNSLAGLIASSHPRLRVDYDASHPWVGAELPLVTIVVFSDYQCPFCARLDETLNSLLLAHPGDLRVVYRQFPLAMHQHARFAAALALAAHDFGQFGAIHGWLYEHGDRLDRPAMLGRLRELVPNSHPIVGDIDAGLYDARIDEDIALAQRFGVSGTPSSFINGRDFSGARPIEELEAVIREELGLAEQMLAAGSPREQVWARIMAAAAPELP